MTIDEQVERHLDWWMRGVNAARIHRDDRPVYREEGDRGAFESGYAAYLAAEQAERERLERCPECDGKGWMAFGRECPSCHGTGKRTP